MLTIDGISAISAISAITINNNDDGMDGYGNHKATHIELQWLTQPNYAFRGV